MVCEGIEWIELNQIRSSGGKGGALETNVL
jgi:hypothetical protein